MRLSPEFKQRWRGISRIGRAVILGAAAGVALVVALLVALFTLPAIGSVSPQALTYSLTRQAEGDLWSTESYTCERHRAKANYTCQVGETGGRSGAATYRLDRRGRRCWRADKTSPHSYEDTKPMVAGFAGCAKWRDQVRVIERLLTPG